MLEQRPGQMPHVCRQHGERGAGPFTDCSRLGFKKSPLSRSLTLILVSLFGGLELGNQPGREQGRFLLPSTDNRKAQTEQRENPHTALPSSTAQMGLQVGLRGRQFFLTQPFPPYSQVSTTGNRPFAFTLFVLASRFLPGVYLTDLPSPSGSQFPFLWKVFEMHIIQDTQK